MGAANKSNRVGRVENGQLTGLGGGFNRPCDGQCLNLRRSDSYLPDGASIYLP